MKNLVLLLSIFFLFSCNSIQRVEEKPKEEHKLLVYAQSKMSINNYVDMMRALEIGERYFNTEKDIVLAVIFIESDFNVFAYNEVTNDYGLSQQNGKYILDRYTTVKKILDKEKIECNVNHRFDIYLNVLACYYYLDHCIELKGTKSKGIKKYNGTGKDAEKYMYKVIDTYFKNA